MRARTKEAFASLETLAVIDVLPTETTALATHLLPAVGALERADLPSLLDTYQLAVATQFTPAMVAPVAQRWPVWRMFGELGERLGLDVLGGGLTAATATDEKLLQPLAKSSRGGADAVFAARSGVVASGAVFGWVRGCCPAGAGSWRREPLLEQLAPPPRPSAEPATADRPPSARHDEFAASRTRRRIISVHPAKAAELGGDGTEVEMRAAAGTSAASCAATSISPRHRHDPARLADAERLRAHQRRGRHRPADRDGSAIRDSRRDPAVQRSGGDALRRTGLCYMSDAIGLYGVGTGG